VKRSQSIDEKPNFTNAKDADILSQAIAPVAPAPSGLLIPSAVSTPGLISSALGLLGGVKPDLGSLDLALRSFARGGDALKALAVSLDFKPPPSDMMTGQSIVGWLDSATGRVFIAPTTGWQAPAGTWTPALRVNPDWIAPYLGGPAAKPDQPVVALPDPAVPPQKPGQPQRPDREESDDDVVSTHPVQEDSADDSDGVGLPGRSDPSGPGMPKPPLQELWSVTRELTDAEWLSLRKAMTVLHDGREAVGELANELGFKPPAEAGAAAQALIGWLNESTGQIFIAPGTGWTPPDNAWDVVAKLPVGNGKPLLGKPHDHVDVPPPAPPNPSLKDAWSVARELSDAEWLSLRKAMAVLHDGREAVGELANNLGFKPPAEAGAAVQVLIGWANESTGQIFIAPSAGWTPPDGTWEVVAKLPVGNGKPPLGKPDDDGVVPLPVAPKPDDHDDRADDHEPPAAVVDPVDGGRPVPAKWLNFAQDAIRMVDNALSARQPIEARLDLVQDPASPDGNTRIEYEWRVGDKVIEGATGMKLPVMPLLAGREVSFRMSVAEATGQPEIITRSMSVDETAKLVAGRLMHWSKKPASDAPNQDVASDAEVGAGVGLGAGAKAAAMLQEMAGADRFAVDGIDFHRFAVRASAQVVDSERSAVGAADVLAALKLAHGRKLSARSDDAGESTDAEPFQLIAADIDGNGVIDRGDAESLLGAVVDRGHVAGRSKWLFVPEGAELAGLSRKSVTWSEPSEDAVDAAPTNWIGVMLGDIDGSWKPDL
jgi:hypothetical protein